MTVCPRTILSRYAGKDQLMAGTKSMRQTKQKDIIMQAVMDHGGHPSAEEVYMMLKVNHPRLSLATVYRNLNLFSQQGQLGCLPINGQPVHYDSNPAPHAHLVCSRCHKIVDLHPGKILPTVLQEFKDSDPYPGFHLQNLQVQFEGLCPDCALQEELELGLTADDSQVG